MFALVYWNLEASRRYTALRVGHDSLLHFFFRGGSEGVRGEGRRGRDPEHGRSGKKQGHWSGTFKCNMQHAICNM